MPEYTLKTIPKRVWRWRQLRRVPGREWRIWDAHGQLRWIGWSQTETEAKAEAESLIAWQNERDAKRAEGCRTYRL